MISLELKYFVISEMLIENNAELDVADKHGESAWFYLCDFKSNKFKKTDFDLSQDYLVSDDMLWHLEKNNQMIEKHC
jgi:hypothetical protein